MKKPHVYEINDLRKVLGKNFGESELEHLISTNKLEGFNFIIEKRKHIYRSYDCRFQKLYLGTQEESNTVFYVKL